MFKMKRTVPLLFLGLLAAPLGCSSGGDVNIGDTTSLGGKLSDYAAEWDGYAEAYTFLPSSSDHIHLTLDAQGNGTVQVGTDPLLPPPTDPNVGFPPGVVQKENIGGSELTGGVLYPVYAARVEANRIQIGLKPNDYYAAWCALQSSYFVLNGYTAGPDGGPVATYAYSCAQGLGGGATAGPNPQCWVQSTAADGTITNNPVDCGKFYLCISQVCACTATACAAAPTVAAGTGPAGYPAELDGALDSAGKALTGTLNVNGTRVTVHLTRK